MTIKTLIQLVEIPDLPFQEEESKNIDFSCVASDADTKTISLLTAISVVSGQINELNNGDKAKIDYINELSGVITSLAEIAIATSKISNSANFSSGYKYFKESQKVSS